MGHHRDDDALPMRDLTAIPFRRTSASHRSRWWIRVAVGYIVLLAVSHAVRLYQPDPRPLPSGLHSIRLPAGARDSKTGKATVMRYIDTRPDAPPETPVVLLVHGSPVAASRAFPRLSENLAEGVRVLAPDLPGFGFSTRKIEDYGFVAHANYLIRFLDRLQVKRVHLVAYSMGGGAAIRIAADQPERIVSLALVSSIGVQELELLGDYHLNHALHGLQLAALWALQELTPHMGLLDRFPLNTYYARNFFDADQRPLRGMLRRIPHPTLIVHGDGDHFVPPAAAKEHARLIPQSVLKIMEGGHLLVFKQTADVARIVAEHIQTVEKGNAVARTEADAARVDNAQAPFGRLQLPRAYGLQLLVITVLIALATLVSEDLACIGAGLMAARGILGFLPATAASFVGIVAGDLMLYGAGRLIGRPALHRRPVRWFITSDDVSRATRWLDDKGPGIIFASRFLPGSRLPVYFTAGVLGSGIWSFLFYFCVAAAIWTPGLVGISMFAGEAILAYYAAFHRYALWVVLATMLALWMALRICVPLLNFKGRRLLLSRYKRIRHWEFWPLWLFYVPVVGYILYLGIRYRHWTLFTAANPGMPAGGVVGESKSDILTQLSASGRVPPFIRVPRNAPVDAQLEEVQSFMADRRVDFPLVCKPDMGERGKDVQFVDSEEALCAYLGAAQTDTIVQQYAGGKEFGVFYYRYPGQPGGSIFAITDKRLPAVTGDGRSTLEQLILMDRRAVCQAPMHLDVHRNRLHEIPPEGKRIQLVSVGTHCRGAIFLDGSRYITPALTRAFDDASRHFKGFYFGRYDIRTNDTEAFTAGGDFKILELNGVTSEATHIYDPANTLRNAWSTLMLQWKIAFKIGELNRQRGACTLTAMAFLKLVLSGGTPHQRDDGNR